LSFKEGKVIVVGIGILRALGFKSEVHSLMK